MTIIQRLTDPLKSTAKYNPETQVAPACILRTYPEKDFTSIMPRLVELLPELFMYGEYEPDNRSGPAIWLRPKNMQLST
ncbi:MAG: hypothetical protein ISS12_10040 [Candidatus Marinimicrobia bacterium]|nr:hypothetical protein [Candidatus Neomarinimicrobiota bacterium]